MRGWWVLAAAVLLAGCVQPERSADSPLSPTEPAAEVAPEPSRDAPTETVASSPGKPAPPPAPPPSTWYLREEPAPGGDPSAPCRTTVFTLETGAAGGCDGARGRRLPAAPAFEQDCPGNCYVAAGPFGAYPAGSQVEGTIYVTDDLVDDIGLELALTSGGATVGAASVDAKAVVGAGGFECTAFPFSFTTAHPTGASAVLTVRVHATESWFIGHGGGCPSQFTIA